MTRKYTDNELLALTRNRREAKALKTRMEKLDEERALYHDMSGKEKSNMKNTHKEHRRSSGSSPFLWDDPQVRNQSVDPALMRRFSKPWSICPAETTHNIMFKEISSVRPISSINTPRPKSEPNWKRKSMTPRSSLNGRTDVMSKEISVFTKDNHSLNNCSSNSKEENIEKKSEERKCDKLISDHAQGSENKSVEEETKINNGVERRHSSGVICDEITTQQDSNGNMADKQIIQSDDVVNGNNNNVEGQQSSNRTDNMKPRTLKKKRKSLSKRPSTAFMTVLPSVSEANNQELPVGEDKNKETENDGLPVSASDGENKNKIDGDNTEGVISTAVEEFSSLHFSENVPSTEDKNIVEINPAINCDVHFNEDNIAGNGTNGIEIERPVTCVVTERQTSRVSASASVQHLEPRPSTVAGGEVLDFESISDAENGSNVIYFKGQKLHNYVSPQRRYKHDPFRFKRREKLFTKLAKDNPDIVEEVRKDSVRVDVRLSKSARSRLLEQLVTENSQRETSRRLAQNDRNMDGRIKKFIGSVSYLCSETDERSKQMHPLLA